MPMTHDGSPEQTARRRLRTLRQARGWTIDELARRTRLTVRNIRAYQSRGLVQPPEIRGRTGYYSQDHVARIELIRELQSEGFNLEAIRRLIEEAGGETEEVLRFEPITPLTARITREEVVYRDVVFPAGTIVLAASVTANRDPAAFPDPHVFDLARDPNPHVGFGGHGYVKDHPGNMRDGIYRSSDGGATFERRNTGLTAQAVRAIASDPTATLARGSRLLGLAFARVDRMATRPDHRAALTAVGVADRFSALTRHRIRQRRGCPHLSR